MSYGATYASLDITTEAVREPLQAVCERNGWTLVDNHQLDKKIVPRAHRSDTLPNLQFDLIIKNPNIGRQAYDIGICHGPDEDDPEKTVVQMYYDKWGGQIHQAWGEECCGLKKEVTIEAIKSAHGPSIANMDIDQFMTKFAKDPQTEKPVTRRALRDRKQAVRVKTLV
jgi:hypothetical protein